MLATSYSSKHNLLFISRMLQKWALVRVMIRGCLWNGGAGADFFSSD